MGNTDTKKEVVFEQDWFQKTTYRIPGLIFHNNTFFAFSEKRLTGSKDYGPMDMVMRRGLLAANKTSDVDWENETILYTAVSVNEIKKRPMNAVPIVVEKEHLILMFNTYPENMPQSGVVASETYVWQLIVKHSYNGGRTWSPDKELPVEDIFQYDAGIPSYCAVGPGHGIRLQSGRLIVSGNVAWPKEKAQMSRPFVIFSDNCGHTWNMGGSIPLPTYQGKVIPGNECQVIEVRHNQIVVNCRTSGNTPRIQCYSSDGGCTFNGSEVMEVLIEPRNGCQASILGFEVSVKTADSQSTWAVFSNPNSRCRRNLSIRLSKDGCKTWSDPPMRVLERLGSAYSDLTCFTNYEGRQKFACLFERIKMFSRSIELVMFDIE